MSQTKENRVAAIESVQNEEADFKQIQDKFFDFLFRANPDWGTVLGFHQYDAMAAEHSAADIAAEIAELKAFKTKFESLKSESLSEQSRIDLQLIKSHINSDLLDLEERKSWQKNPDMYSSGASSMIYDLMTRDFAPLSERLKSVIAREKKIGTILKNGKTNLKNPPRIFTEVAIEQIPGIIDFFENSVNEKFKSVGDKELQSEFQASNKEVIEQLKDYQKFLKEILLPESNGNFALGEDIYRKKLLFDEMEEASIDELLKRGEKELKRLQEEFVSTAKEIDPGKSAMDVFTSISSDHCKPDKLVSSVSAVLKQLKDFCRDHEIITIPSQDNLKVAETPPFMRALTFAAMDGPGPFEEKAKEAYYYVTLPEADWKPERIEEHMRAFCTYDVLNTSVHEAFPGHYVQGLWNRKAPSKAAKILGCNSNVEGWAHYCEQMMLEEGLENGDKKLKMTMLHDALLRCCRYIVGIRMHTRGMTLPEGISFFEKEGYQEKSNAEREAKRGTMDPTYLVYTLGKLQLIALRDDYKKAKGKDFSLKDFHDRVMSTGTPPIKIIREILLSSKNDSKIKGISK
ncbi:MAG: DUF885 domain-containing protein [Candidatus Obscuribacterales bacterium]|nr:DUF885 domain-containing protein [Candidatus Obscuribacterales bacterium]